MIGLLLGVVLVTAASGGADVDKPNIDTGLGKVEQPAAKECVPVDFATAELTREDGRILLKVSGETPHPGMSIEVRPVLYVMQPEYWLMSLVACAPSSTKPTGAAVPFAAAISVGGSVGRKGIELSGKPGGKSKRLDLPS